MNLFKIIIYLILCITLFAVLMILSNILGYDKTFVIVVIMLLIDIIIFVISLLKLKGV